MKRDYLDLICQQILGRSLYNPTDLTSLPLSLSHQLHRIWVRACGIPRTIDVFARKLWSNCTQLVGASHTDSEYTMNRAMENQITDAMTENFSYKFESTYQSADFPTELFRKLMVDCVFCVQASPEAPLASETYEFYEGKGMLIPFNLISQSPQFKEVGG